MLSTDCNSNDIISILTCFQKTKSDQVKMDFLDPDDDPSLHRIEGSSGTEKGGLIIMKKGPAQDANKHEFRKPSLLGRSAY